MKEGNKLSSGLQDQFTLTHHLYRDAGSSVLCFQSAVNTESFSLRKSKDMQWVV